MPLLHAVLLMMVVSEKDTVAVSASLPPPSPSPTRVSSDDNERMVLLQLSILQNMLVTLLHQRKVYVRKTSLARRLVRAGGGPIPFPSLAEDLASILGSSHDRDG
jgi:hypothetical protein